MGSFWKVIAGEGNRYIDDFEEQKCVAVGWSEMGDLSGVHDEAQLEVLYDRTYPSESAVKRGIQLKGITKFRFGMKDGDRIISYDPGTRQYLWGTIRGDYEYRPGLVGDYPNIRRVSWQTRIDRDRLSQRAKSSLAVSLTIIEPDGAILREMEALARGEPPHAEPEPEQPEITLRSEAEKAHELVKDRLSRLDWEEMQDVVAALLRAMGFKTRVSPSGPDRGKDIVASPDGLGLREPRIKVEVKHRGGAMGSQAIRAFTGGLRPGDKGLYVSTGGFTRDAEYEAERANNPVTLVDLDTLATLLVQHYDQFDTEGRALIPLTRVFLPAS